METRVVGLLVDPGWSTKVVEGVVDSLPGLLTERVSDEISWDVRLLSRALPLDESGNVEAWEHSDTLREQNGWDFMVCLTELTRRLGDRFFISDLNINKGAALISLPALGPVRIRHNVRTAVVRVVRALTLGDIAPDREIVRGRDRKRRPKLISLGGWTQHEVTEVDGVTDSYVALSGFGATVRLITGMVYINQPWRLVSSLDKAIAAAAATAAFGIFYSSIWTLANALTPMRLTIISVFAMTAMLAWLIFHNSLWQHAGDVASGGSPAVYNVSTVVTVAIGVACSYLVLVGLVLLGAFAVIPGSYLSKTLGHDIGFGDYVSLAWFVASMGTFAGALGSSFEGDDAIQRATYGRRERERHVVSHVADEP